MVSINLRKKKEMSTKEKILFDMQAMGYDQKQVDSYIQKLMDDYRILQQQYYALTGNIDFCNDNDGEHMMIQLIPEKESFSNALANAKIKAAKIIAEAKNEASAVTENAYKEFEKIQKEEGRMIAEINDLLKELKKISSSVCIV